MVGNRNVRSVTPETSNYEDPKTEPMDIDFSSSGHSSELLPPIQIEALTSATSKSVYDTVTPVGRIPTSLPWSNTTGNALRTPETAPVLEDFDLEILEIPEIPEVTVEVQSPVPNSSAQSIEMDFVKGESKYDNFKLALKDDLPEPAPIEKEVIRDPLEVCLEQNLPPEIWKIIEPVVKDINLRKDDVFTRVISFLFSEETPNIGSVDFLNYMAGEDKRSILPSNIIDSIEDSWGNLIERIIWLWHIVTYFERDISFDNPIDNTKERALRIAEIRRIRKNYSYQCTKFFSHISSEDISGSPYRIIPVANYNIRIREKYRNFSGKSKLKMALLQLYAYFNIRYDHLLDIYLEKKKLHEEEIRRQRAEMVETNIYAIETDIGLHVPNWDIPLVIELLCKQLEAEYPDIEKADESWKEIDWNRVPPEILKELNDKRIKMYSRWNRIANTTRKPDSDFPDTEATVIA